MVLWRLGGLLKFPLGHMELVCGSISGEDGVLLLVFYLLKLVTDLLFDFGMMCGVAGILLGKLFRSYIVLPV